MRVRRMRTGISFTVLPTDRQRLMSIIRDRNAPQKHIARAEIILLSVDSVGTVEIMRQTGKSKTCVWRWQERFDDVYQDGGGMPPLPTRLMAGLAILKHTFNLSDEAVCARYLDSPYCQYFCGETFFQHRLPFDRSSMTRWRQRMGEEKITALLQESLSVAVKTGAMKAADTLAK